MSYRKLWIALSLVLVVSFAVLGGVGVKVLDNAPPIPSRVVTTGGHVLFDGNAIRDGQGDWQSIGGQEVGTIWGHGAYIVPDWSADWLHRECVFILDRWATESGAANYAALSPEQQAALQARLQFMMRHNTYDPATGQITIDPVRSEAFDKLYAYYSDVFSQGRDECWPRHWPLLRSPRKCGRRRMGGAFQRSASTSPLEPSRPTRSVGPR